MDITETETSYCLKGHGHDVRIWIFLHILLISPTEFTDSREYVETL